ncbi:unnamed protein product [Nippostrongylus brasiliensis]|uniref:Uncharacterized protein n=1 Tax=Nippostrongylus brasiliensis TaxID=27835 RepID=A0A0N4XEL8_NIPBR|nr:unnamed protein product [Nippostrongylus brasiliensis]
MSNATLFESLRSDDVDGVRKFLTTKDSSEWPVEVLLPFVLKKSLQVEVNDMELSYVAECLRMVHLLSLLNRGSEVTPQAISSEFVTLPLSDPRYAVFLRLYRMELIEMLSDPVNIECLPTFAKFFGKFF